MKSQNGRTKLSQRILLLCFLFFLTGCKAYYPDPETLEENRDMADRFGWGLGGPRGGDQSPGEDE